VKALFGLAVAVAVLAGCAQVSRGDGFAGAVDIGDGRRLYLNCQGDGSPTVFIIPDKDDYAATWNVVVPQDDPTRASPYDLVDRARLETSAHAVQPAVARTTRVCAYDRPNTRPDGSYRSSSVPQPHSITQDVDDIVKLVAAARLSTPMVVVAHSYGALVADLLARTQPYLVSGLVFVEPTSEFLPRLARPGQQAAFDRAARTPSGPGGEAFLAEDAFARIKAAPLFPKVPAIVLSSDKPPPPARSGQGDYTDFQTRQANGLLAETLQTDNVIIPGSGRDIMLDEPARVAEKIVEIVDRVRAGGVVGR